MWIQDFCINKGTKLLDSFENSYIYILHKCRQYSCSRVGIAVDEKISLESGCLFCSDYWYFKRLRPCQFTERWSSPATRTPSQSDLGRNKIEPKMCWSVSISTATENGKNRQCGAREKRREERLDSAHNKAIADHRQAADPIKHKHESNYLTFNVFVHSFQNNVSLLSVFNIQHS